jgi:hypothetical protein
MEQLNDPNQGECRQPLPGGTEELGEDQSEPAVTVEFGSLTLVPPEGGSWAEWVITRGVDEAGRQDRPIDNRTASYIADWLSGDMTPALRSFVLTGVIDGPGVQEELVHSFFVQTQQVQDWIDWFGQYCTHREDRRPVGDWRADIDREDQTEAQRVRRERILAETDALFEMVPAFQRVGNAGQPGWHGMIRHVGHSGGWLISEGVPGVRRVWETDSTGELEDAYAGIVEAQRQWIIDTWGRGTSPRRREPNDGQADAPADVPGPSEA